MQQAPGACCIKCYELICSQECYEFRECMCNILEIRTILGYKLIRNIMYNRPLCGHTDVTFVTLFSLHKMTKWQTLKATLQLSVTRGNLWWTEDVPHFSCEVTFLLQNACIIILSMHIAFAQLHARWHVNTLGHLWKGGKMLENEMHPLHQLVGETFPSRNMGPYKLYLPALTPWH